MKKLIMIVVLLFLAGCGNTDYSDPSKTIDGMLDLYRYHDSELGVTCWRAQDSVGISCTPDWMLEPPENTWTLIKGCVTEVEYIEGMGNKSITLDNSFTKLVAIAPEVGDYVGLMCNSLSNYCYKVDYVHQQACE